MKYGRLTGTKQLYPQLNSELNKATLKETFFQLVLNMVQCGNGLSATIISQLMKLMKAKLSFSSRKGSVNDG